MNMSCPVTRCHIMSRHVMSRRVLSCQVLSCLAMSCHVSSRLVMSRHVLSCLVMSSHVMSCHVTWCHVMFSEVFPPCHVMLSSPELSLLHWLVSLLKTYSFRTQLQCFFSFFLLPVASHCKRSCRPWQAQQDGNSTEKPATAKEKDEQLRCTYHTRLPWNTNASHTLQSPRNLFQVWSWPLWLCWILNSFS